MIACSSFAFAPALVATLLQPPDSVATVQGRVLDAATGAPVIGVTVLRKDSRQGANTGADGAFEIRGVPYGKVTLVVTRIGYQGTQRDLVLPRDAAQPLVFRLTATTTELGAVKVKAQATERAQFLGNAPPGVVSVTGQTVRQLPVIGEPDVLRVVQLLPGVVATNDFTAGYNVRGGESDQNLVLLDGFPLYNPFHLGGLFGTFIDETVASFDLMPGAFPVRYGGRLSSVLSVEPKAEARSGIHGKASVSLLASTLALGGTVKGSTSWNVAARRTYADKFIALFSDRQLPYWFTDVQAHVKHTLPNGGSLSLTGYWGSDVLDASIASFGDSTAAGGGRLRFDWGNRLIGAAWEQPLHHTFGGDSARAMQRVSYTGFGTLLDLGSGSLTFKNRLGETRAWGELTRYAGKGITQAGYEWSSYRFTYDVDARAAGTPSLLTTRDGPSSAAVYVDRTQRLGALQARVGVRGETVTGANWSALSPRASLKWFANRDLAFTASAGRTAQWTPSLRNEQAPVRVFDFWLIANGTTPVATATQGSLGAERWFGNARFVRAEAWLKAYDRLPSSNLFNDPEVFGDEFIITTGRSYGLDVLVRQLESEKMSGWIAYSFQRSWRDAPTGRFAPVQDRRHNLNVVSSWRPGGNWSYGARLGVGTGTPFTDIEGQLVRRRYDPVTNSYITDNLPVAREPIGGVRNGARYPLVQRLDLSATYANPGKRHLTPYVSLINAYNARNVFTYVFDYTDNPPTRSAFSQFPFLPTLGVSIAW
ncbi:MAG: TonB-dependent receptor [Gemmatimonadaceae bacterium]|nr:TonB-dependent receptor [Gemmatimonadaceae bacterium]